MNIAHIIPGSGGSFYCGNCLRDSKFFQALKQEGHNAIKIPMYLPLFANDDANNGEVPVFYGAISIYLKQMFPALRHAPAWFDHLLNAKPMLKFAAHMANSTRATGLEEMTVSMLMGEEGSQKEELEKMTDWLAEHYQAEVIHISNALLLGLAHKLKQKLNIPLVCSLQDEDVWVDVMRPGFSRQVWQLMREKAADIDLFISVSEYYTAFMKERLSIPDEKISTLHLGVDPMDYTFINAADKKRNIGFLSRMCHENGMDILLDAFILLKQLPGYEDVKLLLNGGHTADDKSFLKQQKQKIKQAGLLNAVSFMEHFEQEERTAFFDQLMMLSVPVRRGEAFGIYLTEAMASGIPVVQPALGAFPEIVKKSEGGIIYQKNTAADLSVALRQLLDDREALRELSLRARKSTETDFNIHKLAGKMTELYQKAKTNKEYEDKGRTSE